MNGATNMNEQAKTPRILRVTKGSRYHGINIRESLAVQSVEISAQNEIAIKATDPRGKVHVLHVRHVNRLSDREFNAHKGDPTRGVKLTVQSWATVEDLRASANKARVMAARNAQKGNREGALRMTKRAQMFDRFVRDFTAVA